MLNRAAPQGTWAVASIVMRCWLAVTLAAAGAAEYPEIGPLPPRKAQNPKAVEMGKRLFFDPRLSGDGAISCADCHHPQKGWGDGEALSKAYPGTDYFRNAPTLLNTVYKEAFADVAWAWDGHMGADLNDVMRDQITETAMMNMDMRLMHERMKQDPVYVQMCQEVYGGECSSGMARNALVAFLETLVSTQTPFDTGGLSPQARQGLEVFKGKAQCIRCHNGPYVSDGQPHNTGVPENLAIFQDPIRHLTYRSVLSTHGTPRTMRWRRDVGYFLVSRDYADVGKFITPSLRYIKYTAPYMHNGAFFTLDEVIDFYNQGGEENEFTTGTHGVSTKTPILKPLHLTNEEKAALVAFLEELSGEEITVEEVVVPDMAPFPDVATLTQKDAKRIGLEDFLARRDGHRAKE